MILSDRVQARGCWTVWLLTSVYAVVHALHYAQRFPYNDDYYLYVPVLTGEQPLTLEWLWSMHNDHRCLIPRLVLVGLARLSGGDGRAAVLLNALLTAAIAAGCLVVVRRRRGSWRASDAFFPLLLLHVGQCTASWGTMFVFVASEVTFLAIALVLIASDELSPRAIAAVAAGCVLMPLYGSNGVVVLPPLTLWLVVFGVQAVRRASSRTSGAVALGGALGTSALVAVYLHGWHALAFPGGKRPTFAMTLRSSFHVLPSAFGPRIGSLWPVGATLTVLLGGGALWMLGRALRDDRRLDGRPVRYLVLVAAMATLALALGRGRGALGWDPIAFDLHYGPLAVPAFCIFYFIFVEYGGPWIGTSLTRLALLAGAGAWAIHVPRAWVTPFVAEMRYFVADLRSGMDVDQLVAHHPLVLGPDDDPATREFHADELELLFEAGYFRRLRTDGPARLHTAPMFWIDRVNDQLFDSPQRPMIDRRTTSECFFQGWAVDPEAHRLPSKVFLVIDRHELETQLGFERSEVADTFHQPAYAQSGFELRMACSELAPGPHGLSLKIISADGRGYYKTRTNPLLYVDVR